MDNQNSYQISPVEMGIVLISMVIGVGILTIPRSLTSTLESPDGWIAIVIAGMIVMVFVYLYVRLQKHFPGQNLIGYLSQGKAGKWIAYVISTGFIFYFTTLLAFEGRVMALVVKMYLLDQTPSEVLVGVILLVTTYAVTKGVQGVVHLCLLFLPIIIFLIVVILTANVPNVEFERMLPVMGDGMTPVLGGVTEIVLSFLGVEILFFMMVYMKRTNIRALPLNISIGIVTILYAWTFVFVVGIFGVEGTQVITFPTVEAAKEIEVLGEVFARLESFMITIWLMTIFNTMSIALLLAVQTIQHVSRLKTTNKLLAPVIFFTFIIAFIPKSITDVFALGDKIGLLGVCLMGVSLVAGFMTVWVRKQSNTNSSARGM